MEDPFGEVLEEGASPEDDFMSDFVQALQQIGKKVLNAMKCY